MITEIAIQAEQFMFYEVMCPKMQTEWQTVETQIRLLLYKEQPDLGPRCLLRSISCNT